MTLMRGAAAKPDWYLKVYEDWFAELRDLPLTLMELGVHTGGSMWMWRDYFTNARIIGVDHIRQTEDIPGVELVITDQKDPLLREYHADIVIDDGSHLWDDQYVSFRNLSPSAALYVIEDLHTAFDENFGPGLNPRVWLRDLTDDILQNRGPWSGIVYYPQMVVLCNRDLIESLA